MKKLINVNVRIDENELLKICKFQKYMLTKYKVKLSTAEVVRMCITEIEQFYK